MSLALWRRGRDRGALAVQQFGDDLLPLVMLFAVSITGVFLTVSTHLMRGLHFVFLSQLHAVTVIFTLLYLPFGKFFHIFQRPAQLGVAFYREAGAKGEAARCARCGEPFASRMHIDDLKQVERELGIRYEAMRAERTGQTAAHYQDVCPPCRRKNLALTQDALWRRGAVMARLPALDPGPRRAIRSASQPRAGRRLARHAASPTASCRPTAASAASSAASSSR